jgi:hypothetical protein
MKLEEKHSVGAVEFHLGTIGDPCDALEDIVTDLENTKEPMSTRKFIKV